MELTRLIVTKPDGTVVGDIDPTLIVDAGFVQEVNGEHSVSLSTYEELSKNDRILWRDEMGHWHENVVEGTEGEHGEHGDTLHEYWCPWSLQHDLAATFVTAMPGTGGTPAPALAALQAALGGTERWQVGTVTQASSGSASMWRVSGWEALQTLVEVWGGELSATIDVDGSGVVGRFVNLLAHVGAATPTRRFDYGGDLMGIRRKVADQPWTCRVVPLGKAQQTEGGGYGRKVTIEDVNGGILWLENAATTPLVRVPTEDGWEYPTQVVENSEIDDPAALKAWALENIDEWTTPKASYEVDVLQLAQAGTDATGVAEGDEVVIVDHGFTADGLAIQGRALRIEGSLLDPAQTTLTISNLSETLGGQLGAIARSVSQLASQQQATSLYQATADYLSQLLARLNGEANATGGYTYITEGEGIRTYDVAVSDPLVGAEASKVVEVKGGTIRIADSRTQAGEWDWRTVFVSGHVLADLVTAAKLTSGYIGSADSGNYWDLDSGEFRMASTAMLGDKTVQQVLDGVDDTITGVDVEFAQGTSPTQAPTSGWQTQPPAWEAGKYIWMRTATTTADGTSYSTPAMISGKDGADGTSVTIKGSYNTLAELQAAHPTGQDGDAYMVGTDLYVWNGSAWEDVGQIQGPQGPAGTSVTVSSIQYGTSTSASTSPTSWTTTPPTSIAAGRWLWVRTNYSNGSTATTKSYVGTNGTSVYVQSTSKVDGVTTIVLASSDGTTSTIRIADGEDGATGQQGPAGENGESNYIHTAWANSQDGTTDFSTTVSAGKSYLGVCTDQNTADPTTPSSYSWSKIEGAAGADGKGVSSVTEQYYLSTSSSTQSGGAWATSPAAYVTGRFYWTRTITTYTDNTAVISEPVLARGLNSANKTAADALGAVDDLSTQDAIFNLLTNDGALQGLYMSGGQLYINANYLMTGIIKSQDGKSFWDLVNNNFQMLSKDSSLRVGLGSSTAGDTTTMLAGFEIKNNSVSYTTRYGDSISVEPENASTANSSPQLVLRRVQQGGTATLKLISYSSDTSFINASNRLTINSGLTTRDILTIKSGQAKTYWSGAGLDLTGTVKVIGNFSASVKNRFVETDNYDELLLYSYETPTPMFGDVGSGRIGEDGLCYVEIDDRFRETARPDYAYQVFLQKCGQGDLWVEEKKPTHFVVRGTPGLPFDWELKARQKDLETLRFEDSNMRDAMDPDLELRSCVEASERAHDEFIAYDDSIDSIYDEEVAAINHKEETNEAA